MKVLDCQQSERRYRSYIEIGHDGPAFIWCLYQGRILVSDDWYGGHHDVFVNNKLIDWHQVKASGRYCPEMRVLTVGAIEGIMTSSEFDRLLRKFPETEVIAIFTSRGEIQL